MLYVLNYTMTLNFDVVKSFYYSFSGCMAVMFSKMKKGELEPWGKWFFSFRLQTSKFRVRHNNQLVTLYTIYMFEKKYTF